MHRSFNFETKNGIDKFTEFLVEKEKQSFMFDKAKAVQLADYNLQQLSLIDKEYAISTFLDVWATKTGGSEFEKNKKTLTIIYNLLSYLYHRPHRTDSEFIICKTSLFWKYRL